MIKGSGGRQGGIGPKLIQKKNHGRLDKFVADDNQISKLEGEIKRLEGVISQKQTTIDELRSWKQTITESLSWRLLQLFAAIVMRVGGHRLHPDATPLRIGAEKPQDQPQLPFLNGMSLHPVRHPLTFLRRVYLKWRNEGLYGLRQAMVHYSNYSLNFVDFSTAIKPVGGIPTVSIVIPAFNNLDYTRQCISSILQSPTNTTFEIIVIDNHSTDGTQEWLAEISHQCPLVRFVRNEENLGFAAGIGTGVQYARGKYLIIANNDILTTPYWIDGMIAVAESDPFIGIVGPVTNYVGEGPQLLPEFSNATPEDIPSIIERVSANPKPLVHVVDRLVFFCVLIKRDAYEMVGGLSGVYGLGNFEDDDLCLRTRLAGFTLAIAPRVFVFHYGSRTFTRQRISHGELMEKNRRIFYERVAGFSTHPLPRHQNRSHCSHLPFVSIIVRTVDRPNLLHLALTSLANQTYSHFETVVVNDGGADISPVLQEFQPDLSIQYIFNEKRKGRSAALNAGIRACRGSWIGYLDDDDILYPTHLELLARAACDHGETHALYADTNRALCHIGEDGDVVICRMPLTPFEFDRNALLLENRIPILSVLHSTECFEHVGMFDEEIDLLEDWDFWLRLSQRHRFLRLPRITAEYRFRISRTLENSITSRRTEAMEAMRRTYERYPVSDPFLQRKRESIMEEMRRQIHDLARIQEMQHDDIKKSYLAICRVTGFEPSEIHWAGYRA